MGIGQTQGKNDLIEKNFKTMNEHFIKLRDSDREEERVYYPGKTAEELFADALKKANS